jgi:hypothetical protein
MITFAVLGLLWGKKAIAMSRPRFAALKSALLRVSVAAAAALALGLGGSTALAGATGSANVAMSMQASPDFDATTVTPVILTASFSVPGGFPAPSGTVSFTADGSTVRPVAPGAGQPTGTVTFSIGPFTFGTVPVGANGIATLKLPITGTAPAFTATYSGDTHFAGSSATKRISP